jgi:DNA gyrase/topoisomerase IV subunit B
LKVFKNNMSDKSEPKITTCKPNENWTKVSFKPDLAKFNMNHLESDVVALMSKRVLDIAGCLGKGCKVELNGKRLPIKSFQDYVGLYLSIANANREEPLPRSVLFSPVKDHCVIPFRSIFVSIVSVSLFLIQRLYADSCFFSKLSFLALACPTTFLYFLH